MKKLYFLVLALSTLTASNAQIITFPDANFKAKLFAITTAKDQFGQFINIDSNNNNEIEVSEALSVYTLYLSFSEISDLTGIQYFTNVFDLQCIDNKLNTLNVSSLINLKSLFCSNNQIQNLNVAGLSNLSSLDCNENKLTSLTLTGLPNLAVLQCNNNLLTELDLTNLSNLYHLECNTNQLVQLNLTGISNLGYLDCSTNLLPSLNVSELIYLDDLECYSNKITALDLTGSPSLTRLECFLNQISTLNLTGLSDVTYLDCSFNLLTSLNVSELLDLRHLYCESNQISTLDLKGLSNIFYLDSGDNLLTSLDVTGLPDLSSLGFYNNQIATIDLSNANQLRNLYAGATLIENVDFSKVPDLEELWIGHTAIQTLDLSNLKTLTGLNVSDCPNLESINLKNGSLEDLAFLESEITAFLGINANNFSNCPELQYICGDESELVEITQKIASYNYSNCVVGSYCSYNPGGDNYIIQGNNKVDSDNNGCDNADGVASNIKYTITDGNTTGSLITDKTGNYSIKVKAGSYSITPILENPDYFSISPASINIDFPTEVSPFIRNFCITPISSHKDLENTLIPLEAARPGFDVKYKIIYKNKGNTTQSGSVDLTFDDAVLDLVVANPVTTTQTTNHLSWNFTNLLPFETREIAFTLNVNSPMETPAVNDGSILVYKAAITSAATDETPIDNTFDLNQTVVNSFDPNDKTCLEGNTISPALIGQYVHYMIRFENTGTFPAQNIVVKDMIDLTKFDITTLVPTNASHSYITKISAGNNVEFIFENVNLPFDDANNDGYIAFKIKTLPTLAVNDTFANEASIFFDYNFPIVTNKATATFKTLGVPDFEFSNYFTLYPNPAKSVLNISSKEVIEVKSINVYNTLGQLVLVVPNAEKVSKIDVSSLITGNYFIKINSDKGTSNTRFFKE